MPTWFVTLGYITLSVIMVLFLLGVSASIVIVAVVAVRDWLEDRRHGKRKA